MQDAVRRHARTRLRSAAPGRPAVMSSSVAGRVVPAPVCPAWPRIQGGDDAGRCRLDVALSTVRPEEREGYIERLEAFVEQHRARLEEMLRTHGPGSTPASHGRYALIGQPETLVILERMATAPFLLRGQWEKELETVFLDDLEFAWGLHIRLSR